MWHVYCALSMVCCHVRILSGCIGKGLGSTPGVRLSGNLLITPGAGRTILNDSRTPGECLLRQSFLNVNVPMNHSDILLKCSWSGVGPKILHF